MSKTFALTIALSFMFTSQAQAVMATETLLATHPREDQVYVEAGYFKSAYTLDVINQFADHVRVNSNDADEYVFKIGYSFTDSFYVFAKYNLAKIEFEESLDYELESDELDYSDYHAGAGLYWGDLGFRLAYGQFNYHTFLETDTAFYFHDKLKSDYVLFGVDYNFQTSFWFDVELFLDNQYYIPSTLDDYEIENGYVRRWGGKLVFGYRDIYLRLGYENTYRNVKMIHDFFTLKNEMNNKLQSNQFSATISYQF